MKFGFVADGFVILQCEEPVTGRATGQLLLDYLTDTVLSHKPGLVGKPMVSPDSRHVVTLDKQESGVTLVVQEILRECYYRESGFRRSIRRSGLKIK